MSTIESLIADLQNPDKYTRLRAAGELGEFNDPRAVQALLAALYDKGSNVRVVALQSLGKIGALAARPLITALCNMDRPESMGFAYVPVEVFSTIGTPAVDPLIAALRTPNAYVREIAATALGRIGDSRALPELERAALQYPDYEWEAKQAAQQGVDKLRGR